LKLIVPPGVTLVAVGKPSISPHALGEYQSDIGVPGCEFSQTIGFEPAPQAPVSALEVPAVAIMAIIARTSTTAYRLSPEACMLMNRATLIRIPTLGIQ
jgi:hypothetical protein